MICKSKKRYLTMSNTATSKLQLFSEGATKVQTAKLDGEGPFVGGLYKVGIYIPEHHKTDEENGESQRAGSGFPVGISITGMSVSKATQYFASGVTIEVIEKSQEGKQVVDSAEYKFVNAKMVTRSITGGSYAANPYDQNGPKLDYCSLQFTYDNGTYKDPDTSAGHLTPNHGGIVA